MLRALGSACVIAGFCVAVSVPLPAQEVIHALTGTVSAINNAEKTVTVFEDNGSQGVFQDVTNSKARISFDKKIAAETVSADAFKNNGAYVIVFYYGGSDDPTVVGFKSLGAGPFTSTTGSISRFEGHEHTLLVEDSSGKMQSFKITADTVAEGGAGVVSGLKLDAQRGDHVRVVSAMVDGAPTALFVGQN